MPGGEPERRVLLVSAFFVGLALVVATLSAGGPERLLSPFVWQDRRGLQVEAFAALPFLWARHFDPGAGWTTPVTEFNCYEVKGPGVEIALQFTSLGMLLGVIGLAALYVRAFRAPAGLRTPMLAARLLVLGVLVFLAANKAFSPQYLVWVAAPLAVLGALPGSGLSRANAALFLRLVSSLSWCSR